ncbi:MAG: hypothetical protein ABW125_18840 [Candidatus Thiodiazotropha lotti]
MKPIPITLLALSFTLLFLSGCGTQYKTVKILSQDEAQVVFTLNKGYTNTVLIPHEGKRIDPVCIFERSGKDEGSNLPLCKDVKPTLPKSAIVYQETVHIVVKEGSKCIEKSIGNYKFEICDPPHDLSRL